MRLGADNAHLLKTVAKKSCRITSVGVGVLLVGQGARRLRVSLLSSFEKKGGPHTRAAGLQPNVRTYSIMIHVLGLG